MKMNRREFLAAATMATAAVLPAQPAGKVVLIVAADASWFSHAAGTVAKMIGEGAAAQLVRVANDEKESWGLSPEETAFRNRTECEAAAKLLGIGETISFGYRSSELRDIKVASDLRWWNDLSWYFALWEPRRSSSALFQEQR